MERTRSAQGSIGASWRKALAAAAAVALLVGMGYGTALSAHADELPPSSGGSQQTQRADQTPNPETSLSPTASPADPAPSAPTDGAPNPDEAPATEAPATDPVDTPATATPRASAATSETRAAPSAAKTGRITGIVRSDKGVPQYRALVEVYWPAHAKQKVRTDANGKYTITGLGTRLYKLEFRPERIADGLLEKRAHLEVTSGKTVKYNATLTTGGVVSGTAKDAFGAPITGATVSTSGLRPNRSTTTGATGKYTIRGINGESFHVALTADGFVSQKISSVAKPGDSVTVNFVAQTSPVVKGVVTASDTGEPLKGITVSVGKAETVTNSAGRYRLKTDTKGERYVNAESRARAGAAPNYLQTSDTVVLVPGEEKTLNLVMKPGGTISGVVKDKSGALFARGTVHVLLFASYEEDDGGWYEDGYDFVQVDSKGRYVFDRQESGYRYRLAMAYCDTPMIGEGDCAIENFGPSDLFIDPPQHKVVNVRKNFRFRVGHPTVSGARVVGATLRANPTKPSYGESPIKPSKNAYRWYRNGKPIGGATSRSYTLKPQDAGARISVKYTAKRKHFTDASKMSARTGGIAG